MTWAEQWWADAAHNKSTYNYTQYKLIPNN